MGAGTEWWRTGIFEGPWGQVQRRRRTPEQIARETDFIAGSLGLAPGSRVLDVPCGTGDLSVALAARGCEVVGVDITRPYVDEARAKADAAGVDLRLHCADMRQIGSLGRFDAVLCWWGSFGYLDDDGDRRFLEAVASALRPGGRFLLDTHVEETLRPTLDAPRVWWRSGETFVLVEREFDPVTRRTETDWYLVGDGGTTREHTSIRLYAFDELTELLATAGLEVREVAGAIDGTPFGEGSARAYLQAERPPAGADAQQPAERDTDRAW
ncbi:MAG: cyclopropane-fatty-acyl-phospholipid synthase family protein [Thermoleophilia bacterium]